MDPSSAPSCGVRYTSPTRAFNSSAHQGRSTSKPTKGIITKTHKGRQIASPSRAFVVQAQQGRPISLAHQGHSRYKPIKGVFIKAHKGRQLASPPRAYTEGPLPLFFCLPRLLSSSSGVVQSPHNQAHKGHLHPSPPRAHAEGPLPLAKGRHASPSRAFNLQAHQGRSYSSPTRASTSRPTRVDSLQAHQGSTQRVRFPSFSACQGFSPSARGGPVPPQPSPQGRPPRVPFPSPSLPFRTAVAFLRGGPVPPPILFPRAHKGLQPPSPSRTLTEGSLPLHSCPLGLLSQVLQILQGLQIGPAPFKSIKDVHRGSASLLSCPLGLLSQALQVPQGLQSF